MHTPQKLISPKKHTKYMVNTENGANVYSVTRLNREVRAILEGSFPTLWVKGEISNLAKPGSGHLYFSLKDSHSQVRCAMFRNRNRFLKFDPDNGSEVLIQANAGLYEGRGEFQLIVEHMEVSGAGTLQKAFEQLKQKLHGEGLFSDQYKQALPPHPQKIGVITSPSGAAIRDILTVLKRRYPLSGVTIYPVPVQGESAATEINNMLKQAENRADVDVIILARGGGSMEDLWAFNDETLARTISQCSIPIITGIGHEIDYTIADFVADYRAATPSVAAEQATPHIHDLQSSLLANEQRLVQLIKKQIRDKQNEINSLTKGYSLPKFYFQNRQQQLDNFRLALLHSMRSKLKENREKLNRIEILIGKHDPLKTISLNKTNLTSLRNKLHKAIEDKISQLGKQLHYVAKQAHDLSPMPTLSRGYTLTTQMDGKTIIQSSTTLDTGELITTHFSDGQVESKVTKIKNSKP